MSRSKKIFSLVIVLVVAIVILYIVSKSTFISQSSREQLSLGSNDLSYDLPSGAAPEMVKSMSAPVSKAISGKIASYSSDSSSGDVSDNSAVDRLIVKSGQFSLVVKDVVSTSQSIADYAVAKGGFLVSKNISKSSDNKSYTGTVVIRVPVKEFDNTVGEYKKMGEVKSQNITGQDVTEDYVDTQSQLKNLKATEAQFLEIMKKATEIKDILAVQNELSTVRGNIERSEGHKKYLEQSASMSAITVYLSTDAESLPVVGEDNSWEPIKVIKDALRGLLEAGKTLSYIVIWLVVYIPLWLLIALVIWIIRRIYRKYNSQ